MKKTETELLQNIVDGGLVRFILLRGVLLFGGSTFVLTQFTNNNGWTVPAFDWHLLKIGFLFLLGGALVGSTMWFAINYKLAALKKKQM